MVDDTYVASWKIIDNKQRQKTITVVDIFFM